MLHGLAVKMAGVVIEELDNSSEDSFGTPKSSHSNDEFHDPALDPQEKPGAMARPILRKNAYRASSC